MRREFVEAVLEACEADEQIVFISGDLGFMALEELKERLGPRFINAGIAEQNMVSVAAGLAASGFTPIVYSIAPFATLRPFEQIRNDICLHGLSVKIVGNGGGYGYGIMGATHHALEDVGVMRTLPNMRVFVPAFGGDVGVCFQAMRAYDGPTYLRLGKAVSSHGEICDGFAGSGMRRVCEGKSLVVVAMGPVIENVIELLPELPNGAVDLWTISEFPVVQLSEEFVLAVSSVGKLLTVEEHYLSGGMAENLAPLLMKRLIRPIKLVTRHALGYPSQAYGSQRWHQRESGLQGEALLNTLKELLVSC